MRSFLIASLLAGVLASAIAAPPRTLRFEQLNVEDGLAQESVLAIGQDRQGFMWFGSQAGLSRFDGYRTVIYRNSAADPDSLAENWVRVLHFDPQGRMWLGTDGGLDRFDPRTRKFIHYLPQEPGNRGNGNRHVRAIIDDGAGSLWVGTSDGLQRFDPATGRFTIWHSDPARTDTLAHDQVNSLALDKAGRLWIATPAGVDMLAPGAANFRHFQVRGAAGQPIAVQTLLLDKEENLWVGTHAGMERWKLRPGVAEPERARLGDAEGLPPGTVMSAYQDSDGIIWVGMRSEGLFRWRAGEGRFVRYRHQVSDSHSLADNYVSSLFRDRAGTLWVGTWYNGASRVDLASGGFARLVRDPDQPQSLSDNKVRSIVDAGGGKIWIGNNAGLNLYDPVTGANQTFNHHSRGTTSDENVTALWRDGGVLWVGYRNGVRRFDIARGQFGELMLTRGDPETDTVRYLYGDRGGMLWVATRYGLHQMDPGTGKVRTFRHDPADGTTLADNTVRPLLEDSQGNFWIGTFNGLDLLDRKTGRFTHYRHKPQDPASLSHDEVHYLYEGRDGAIWVGTAAGLNRMERNDKGEVRFRRYLRKDGLADDSIAAILGDKLGQLWLSTNTGISRLDLNKGTVRNYTGADGTIEGAYFDGSAMEAPDNTLYFGGFNGITAFDPVEIRENSIVPAVAITDFQVFNKTLKPGQASEGGTLLKHAIEYTDKITLGQQDAVFSFEFSALHYAAPQRNRFAYQLQGFDKEWVVTDAGKRFATYTNLDPGHYTFRVKAANKDGIWTEQPATLEVTIMPPFWKSWWFRTVIGLLALGGGFGLYRARAQVQRALRSRLEQQVSLRTSEVEQKNRMLQQQKQELEQRDERLSQAKQKAEDATRQKSEFLANMSHEMRTPLAGVIGMLGFALRDETLQASTREQIERGQANAQSLLSIINDLLDFSKIEAGKLTIENIDFALAGTVENVVSLFEEQAAAHSVGFRVDFVPGLPPFVVGDPTRLRQVLVNLVGNAFKFTQRGHVTLRVERITDGSGNCTEGCNMIRFSVQDTGIGIPEEELPRLFEKFEQADATTTRRYGGTGLGLAICRQLVELMKGEITAVSQPGKGSMFSFTLPLPDGVPPPLVPHVPREPHSHQLKVLCAEDFPTNQIIVRMMLEDLGHKVDIAGNGALAVAACANTRYDLILMDGRMPEMDGPTATRLIRAGGPLEAPVRDQELMIIALTANASEEDRSRYLAAGMDDFLTKPIDEAALHYQLSRAIERQLQRGIVLPIMPRRGTPTRPTIGELDAMFGVVTTSLPERAHSGSPDEAVGALRLRLRDAFIADLPSRLDELDAALAAADADAAGRLFHGMKGSAAYLGAEDLHNLCAELERAADRALWPAIRHKLPRLHQMLSRIVTPAGKEM